MLSVGEVAAVMAQLAPLELAEEWDNVGLLVGDPHWPADRVMTCLTITPESVAEAIRAEAQMIVVHHPLPFRPLSSITTATTAGRLLVALLQRSIAVYSAHTAFDSAAAGVNHHLAIGLGLQEIRPLVPAATSAGDEGAGRWGLAGEPTTLDELARKTATFLELPSVRVVGDMERPLEKVAVACGSGGSLLSAAIAAQCDALVTGEASFHHCLEAQAREVAVVLAGHFASERFAMAALADYLSDQLSGLQIWACRVERDPIRVVDVR